jgi:hypothetical protein
MATADDDLHQFVVTLTQIQSATIDINGDARRDLHAFLALQMNTFLKSKDTVRFLADLSKRLGSTVSAPGLSLSQTFMTLAEIIVGRDLGEFVNPFVGLYCDPSAVIFNGYPDPAKSIADGFPNTLPGNAGWNSLLTSINNLNLDSVIASPSGNKLPNQIVMDKLNGFRAAQPPVLLSTLCDYLSTI